MTSPDYTSFKALAFDIYGTLIDWESSIAAHFQHHIGEDDSKKVPLDKVLKIFRKHEKTNEAVHLTNVELSGITSVTTGGTAEGVKIADWPAFPDTVEAMHRLKSHYRLIALSNIDCISFSSTLSGPLSSVSFDAAYIAEDIGSYKPDPWNFEYLISHAQSGFGIEKEEICMVAHGLETDHAVLPKVGMRRGVWIMREDGERLGQEAGKIGVGARFETLGDFADAVDRAFKEREEGTQRGEKEEGTQRGEKEEGAQKEGP